MHQQNPLHGKSHDVDFFFLSVLSLEISEVKGTGKKPINKAKEYQYNIMGYLAYHVQTQVAVSTARKTQW